MLYSLIETTKTNNYEPSIYLHCQVLRITIPLFDP